MTQTLVDNDVLIKGSAFALWDHFPPERLRSFSVLGVARFVVRDAIARHRQIDDKGAAQAEWEALLDLVEQLEPTEDERATATLLEEAANRSGLPLDVGESQLCAVAMHRAESVVLTGDKRAIVALEQLRGLVGELVALDGRMACLEQLLHVLMGIAGGLAIRSCVCSEAGVDRALSICFSCSSKDEVEVDEAGLVSYIEHLRGQAPHLLAAALPS
jgi:hypothetical protein